MTVVYVKGRGNMSNNTLIGDIEHYDEVEANKIKAEKLKLDKEWFNCYVPVGTLINTSRTNNAELGAHIHKVISLSSGKIVLQRTTNTLSNAYTISQFNDYLQTGAFKVVNITPLLKQRIGQWSNVVLFNDFKKESKENAYFPTATFNIRKHGNNGTMSIGSGFTGNCQLSIIGNMASLITMSSHLKLQLKEIYLYSNRKLLLCDIRSQYLKNLQEQLPKTAFNTITPYTSTNGSQMVICILNISNL